MTRKVISNLSLIGTKAPSSLVTKTCTIIVALYFLIFFVFVWKFLTLQKFQPYLL